MKKTMAVLLAALLLLCACSCTGKATKEADSLPLINTVRIKIKDGDGEWHTVTRVYEYQSVIKNTNGLFEAYALSENDTDTRRVQIYYTADGKPLLENVYIKDQAVQATYLRVSPEEDAAADKTVERIEDNTIYYEDGTQGIVERDEDGKLTQFTLKKDGRAVCEMFYNDQELLENMTVYTDGEEVLKQSWTYTEKEIASFMPEE